MSSYRFALLGHPVSHSLSPRIHERAFELAGLEGTYSLIDVSEVEFASKLNDLAADGFAGVNVTIPHKRRALQLMDRLSPEAELCGSVNTVVFEKGSGKCGMNTDVHGFIKSCSRFVGRLESRRRALVLGTGGAARAVVVGLCQLQFESVIVVGRSLNNARSLVDSLRGQAASSELRLNASSLGSLADDALEATDLLVNATPVGQAEETISPAIRTLIDRLASACLVHDLVYSSSQDGLTPLVKAACERGLAAQDGLEMLVGQAIQAFEIWTGVRLEEGQIVAYLRSQSD